MDEPFGDVDSPPGMNSVQQEQEQEPDDADGQKEASNLNRKAQNRIAQRDFRLRKQQYIRDLEAKVEVLSGDKEERLELMNVLLRNMLKENKDLRSMVKQMATFLGEGLGSCLPRLGLTPAQLDAIINQTESESAHEAFLNLKAAREALQSNKAPTRGSDAQKRSISVVKRKRSDVGLRDLLPFAGGVGEEADLPSSTSAKGKGRAVNPGDVLQTLEDDFRYLFPEGYQMPVLPLESGASTTSTMLPMQQTVPQAQPPYEHSHGYAHGLFSDVQPEIQREPVRSHYPRYISTDQRAPSPPSAFGVAVPSPGLNTNISSLAGPPMSPLTSKSLAQYAQRHRQIFHTSPNLTESDRHKLLGNAMADMTSPMTAVDLAGRGMTGAEVRIRMAVDDPLVSQLESVDASDRRLQAMNLISYHLDNYRKNPEYRLPLSLQPTSIQQTIPHEHIIDNVIFPAMRDRMILLRGRYALVAITQAMLTEIILNGDDILDHNSYEVSEQFCNDYSMIMDDEVYAVTNQWRALRGEGPVQRPDGGHDQLDLYMSGQGSSARAGAGTRYVTGS